MIENRYSLPELSFIGGNTQTLVFDLLNSKGIYVNADYIDCELSISNYSGRFMPPIVVLKGRVVNPEDIEKPSFFEVDLRYSDTINCAGKYVYQITLMDLELNTETYQGIINIAKNTNPQSIKTTELVLETNLR